MDHHVPETETVSCMACSVTTIINEGLTDSKLLFLMLTKPITIVFCKKVSSCFLQYCVFGLKQLSYQFLEGLNAEAKISRAIFRFILSKVYASPAAIISTFYQLWVWSVMAMFGKSKPEKQIAAPCFICDKVDQLVETSSEVLDRSLDKRTVEKLKSILKKLTLKVGKGAGKFEDESFNNLAQNFMSRSYPDASKNAYQWPLVFEYEHPGESMDVIFKQCSDAGVPELMSKKKKQVTYGTVQRKRKGELPEEKTFSILCTMFEEKNIPSFVINGYIWNQYYPKKLFDIMKGLKACIEEGEIDLLVSLPGSCLMLVEVKAVNYETKSKETLGNMDIHSNKEEMDENIVAVTCKAFSQCNKTMTFIASVNCDLFHEKNIPFIKVAALPNCSRQHIHRLFCSKCSSHVITEDELTNTEKMFEWFTNIMKEVPIENSDSVFTEIMHGMVVGRMLGPKSLVQTVPSAVQRTFKQITEKHGTAKKVRVRWFQLNPEQLHVALRNPKLLWLTGEPGSGKTVLAISKIQELYASVLCMSEAEKPQKAVVIVIPGMKLLCQNYHEWLKELSSTSVQHVIEEPVNFMAFGLVHKRGVEYVIKIIKRYQDKHQGCLLHFFVDESHMLLSNTDCNKFQKLWVDKVDQDRLGHVWIIQNPDSTQKDDTTKELPGFQKVHLTHIMRMSKQVTDFVNLICDRSFMHGHGVTGNLPTMFTMKCICDGNTNSAMCLNCQDDRRAHIILKSLKYLKVTLDCESDENELSISDVVITVTDPVKNAILPIIERLSDSSCSHRIGQTMYNPMGFMGCEAKIIMVELESALNTDHILEAFTRPLSQLVILNTGLAKGHQTKVEAYKFLEEKLSTVAQKGLIRIKFISPGD